jgi:putative transposase
VAGVEVGVEVGRRHLVRDEDDFRAHIDHAHMNPVKHGLVRRVADWAYSTFHRLVRQGLYASDRAGGKEAGSSAYKER